MAEKWSMNRETCFSVPFQLRAILGLPKFWIGISTLHMIRVETLSWSNMLLMSEIPVLSICPMMGIIQGVPWVRLTQLRARSVHYLQDFAIPFIPHCDVPASLCHWALPGDVGLAQISPIPFSIMPFTLKTAILKARLIFFLRQFGSL